MMTITWITRWEANTSEEQAAINTLLTLLGVLVVQVHLGSYGVPVMIHYGAAMIADYKESIVKLLAYDAQDMLRTIDCTIVIYLT